MAVQDKPGGLACLVLRRGLGRREAPNAPHMAPSTHTWLTSTVSRCVAVRIRAPVINNAKAILTAALPTISSQRTVEMVSGEMVSGEMVSGELVSGLYK